MSQAQIDIYLNRVESYLSALPAAERDDILAELRSHFTDRAAESEAALTASMAAMGSPEEFARSYLDDETLRQALAGGGPGDVLLGVLRQAPRRLGAVMGFAVVLFFYLFALSCFGVILLDLANPEATGLWAGPGMEPFFFGMIGGAGPGEDVRDLAGIWLIPLALSLGTTFTVCGMVLSRWFAKKLLKN